MALVVFGIGLFGLVRCGRIAVSDSALGNTSKNTVTGIWNAFTSSEPKTCKELLAANAELRTTFNKRIERQGGAWELEYRPPYCSVCHENDHLELASVAFRSELSQVDHSSIYVLRVPISSLNATDTSVELWASTSNILEVINGDTVTCSFSHLELLPAVVPYQNLVIGFESVMTPVERTVVIRDVHDQFGGDLIFTFARHELDRTYRMLDLNTALNRS